MNQGLLVDLLWSVLTGEPKQWRIDGTITFVQIIHLLSLRLTEGKFHSKYAATTLASVLL